MPLSLASIRDFPPIRRFREGRFEREFLNCEAPGSFRGIHSTFEAAISDLPNGTSIGFDQPGTGDLYTELFRELREWEYPVLYWLDRLMPDVHSVFDFGGHVGILYYGFSRYLDFPSDFRWTVLDVPEVRRRGAEIAAEKGATHLGFTGELSGVNGHDLLLTSGAQPYVETLIFDEVESVERPPKELIVNMVPLHDEMEYVTVQSVLRTFCPYKVFRTSDFLETLDRCGWEVRDHWVNPGKSCEVAFHPETRATRYHGFYCTRR